MNDGSDRQLDMESMKNQHKAALVFMLRKKRFATCVLEFMVVELFLLF